MKGILNVAGEVALVAVHGVQRLEHPPTLMRAWLDADRSSCIVFIVDGLDPVLTRCSLLAFGGIPTPVDAGTLTPIGAAAR